MQDSSSLHSTKAFPVFYPRRFLTNDILFINFFSGSKYAESWDSFHSFGSAKQYAKLFLVFVIEFLLNF